MHDSIKIKGLTRAVGHTSLNVELKRGKAVKAKLEVEESRRFFKQAVMGKPYQTVPSLVSRICGTCGLSHMLCSMEAIEKAFKFKPSEQTIALRRLASNSNMLRDHAMHLYFFCLPDLLGKGSILDLEKTHHSLIHDALNVKKAGNILGSLVAGRSIHPTTMRVGGFTKIPEASKIKDCVKSLKTVRPKVLELIEIFSKDLCRFDTNCNFVALKTKGFNFLEGHIQTSLGGKVKEKDFKKHLKEFVLPYSTSVAFKFDGREYMVGALARVNLNKKELHNNTKTDAKNYLKRFPSKCVFNNNLAQAIEMLHCLDASVEVLESFEFKEENPVGLKPSNSEGVGVIEAPRGTLYHHIAIEDGRVKDAEFVIPTSQNIIKLEQDIVTLVNGLVGEKSKKEIQFQIERLIRAYDPCLNCATHFLKVNWV